MPMKATVHRCIFIPCITYLYEKKVALLFISLLPDLVRFFNPYSQSTHQTEISWSDLLQSFCPYSAVICSRLLLWPFILVLFLRAWSAHYHHILLDAQTISCCQVWHRINFMDRRTCFSLLVVLLYISYRLEKSTMMYVSPSLCSGREGRSRQSNSVSRLPRFFHIIFNHFSFVNVPNFLKRKFNALTHV